MEQCISKAALVAEIKRRMEEEVSLDENGGFASYADHIHYSALEGVLSFLDTLEVKDVDLEDDVDNILESYDWNYNKIDFCQFAKHFFELGLKAAQKGE